MGIGTLLAELARLKELLTAEGLFAPERKQPLPFIPTRVGLICGRASAAMEDVLANARDRWPAIDFEIREVPVQGVQAVPAITEALAELDALPDVDVIIVTRGGGSVEDLLPFSNEALVRAVSACRTPVVSAIGHEQDAPLIDFVADLRASTPTDAAKRVVPSLREETSLIDGLRRRGVMVMRNLVAREDAGPRASSPAGARHPRSADWTRPSAMSATYAARVRSLSPAATLERGYAIVMTADGAIVRDSQNVPSGADLDIRVAAGRLRAVRTDEPGN